VKKDKKRIFRWCRIVLACCLLVGFMACDYCRKAEEPAYFQVVELYGSPYERGFQHGRRLSSEIRSLYTMLLANSIYPYLNREQEDIASVLLRYKGEEYANGMFSFMFMLESAHKLLETMPREHIEEMQGIADGSGVSLDTVLIMNTFFDSLLGFRALTFYIKLMQGPVIQRLEFVGGLAYDGKDNDGDGEVDERGEGIETPYEPKPHATMVEVPTDVKFRFIIDDVEDGVDPDSLRFQVGENLYTAGHPSIEWRPYAREGKTIEVIFTPPNGLPEASGIPLLFQCYDFNEYVNSPPLHPRPMRDERIFFTTVGYGKEPHEVENAGVNDGRTQPPSIGFAVQGDATADGGLFVGHNFGMLDSDITHKHATMFVHHPTNAKPFAVVGYSGIIWGFSGINAEGVTFLFNPSDTLNNSFTDQFNEGLIFAKLLPDGVPIGMMGRKILETCGNVGAGLAYLERTMPTFGWNLLLADASGDMAVVELDSDIMGDEDGGFFYYRADPADPGNLDSFGLPLASVGRDDIRVGSHFQKNLDEVNYDLVTFNIRPQRYWSTFYYRSLKAFFFLGELIDRHYGEIDLPLMKAILSRPEMEDQRDGMNSAIYRPQCMTMYVAAGQVPPTSGGFQGFDLGALFGEGGAP